MAKLGPKIEDTNRIPCPVDGIEIFVRHENDEVWIQIRQRNEVKWFRDNILTDLNLAESDGLKVLGETHLRPRRWARPSSFSFPPPHCPDPTKYRTRIAHVPFKPPVTNK